MDFTKSELFNVIMNTNSRLLHGDLKDYNKDELIELVTTNNIVMPDINLLKQKKKELKEKKLFYKQNPAELKKLFQHVL